LIWRGCAMNNQRCTGADSPVTHLIIKRGGDDYSASPETDY
jgi:hypothetical protein